MGVEQVGWLQTAIIIQTGVTAAAAVIGFLLLWGYRAGKFVSTVDGTPKAIEELRLHVDEQFRGITVRFDKGNAKMSDLASEVQTMPDRLRKEFVLRLEDQAHQEASAQFRVSMRAELDRMWSIIDRRQTPRE